MHKQVKCWNKRGLSDSDHGMVVGRIWAGLSISESAALQGFSHTTGEHLRQLG